LTPISRDGYGTNECSASEHNCVVPSIAAGFVMSWDSSGDLSGYEETRAIAAAGVAVV
jgi:hypothetical protein